MDAGETAGTYRPISGVERRMASPEQPGCCDWLLRFCSRCFNAGPDDTPTNSPRPRALEPCQYEAPAAAAPSSSSVSAQQQRSQPAYPDDEADAGPLLPKTVEPSAVVPRPSHSRNNSAASAAASEPLGKRHSGTHDGLHGAADAPKASSHRRTGSYGDATKHARRPMGTTEEETRTSAAAAAEGGPPSTAAGRPGAAHGPKQDEEDDFCPTCLEAYTTENPKIFTECGHHFHMPCIYAWLERKDTCPMCECPMSAPGM